MLIDTHAHLTDEVYSGGGEIIKNMKSDNLEKIITVSYDIESSLLNKKIAENNKDVYYAAGIHPTNTNNLSNDYLDILSECVKSEKCVAIGEIGLDYHYDNTNKELQYKTLLSQLEVLEQSDLPVIFHVRDADGEMLEIVKQNIKRMPKRGVLHCFAGSYETALEYIKLGFYISFTGVITFKNAKKFPSIIAGIPKDRILVETDCPYLCPSPYRGEVNYPKMVNYVAEKIAEIWGVDMREAEKITTENAYRLFDKMRR